LSIGQNPKGLY